MDKEKIDNGRRLSRLKAKWHVCWKQFCDNTSLHGFKETYEAKHFLTKFIWYLLIAGFAVVSCYESYTEISQYMDRPVITRTSVMDPKDALIYPDLKICYRHWMKWLDWNKAFSVGLSKRHVLYAVSYLGDVFSESEFDVSKTREEFDEILGRNNITKFSEFFSKVAFEYPPGFTSRRPLWQENETVRKEINLDVANPLSMCYTISGKKIYDRLKYYVANQESLTLINMLYDYEPDYPKVLSKNEMEFNIKNEFGIVSRRPSGENLTKIDLPPEITVDGIDIRNILITKPYYEYYIQISVAMYNWKNRKSSICVSNWYSDCYCRMRCEFTVSFALNITPCINKVAASILFHNWTENEMPICENYNIQFRSYDSFSRRADIQNYENLAASQEYDKRYLACLDDVCLRPCREYKYDYKLKTKALEYEVQEKIPTQYQFAHILIDYPKISSIFVTTEVDAQTWDSMISDLGGILGLWLGASILSFFQIFYYLCQPLLKLF